MHDCRTINSKLVDLVFDELQAEEKLRLLAEVETCAICLSEYRSITGTLLVFDRAAEATLPDESYWPEHRKMLGKCFAPAVINAPRSDPFWKRIFTARLPVPVPLAVAIALALLVSSALALRRPSKTDVPVLVQPSLTLASPPPTVIEVPVYREKVVTRTVYVEKREREKTEARRPASPTFERAEPTLTALQAENESGGEGGIFTRANLAGFQPPDELKIRIVKRSNSDEN